MCVCSCAYACMNAMQCKHCRKADLCHAGLCSSMLYCICSCSTIYCTDVIWYVLVCTGMSLCVFIYEVCMHITLSHIMQCCVMLFMLTYAYAKSISHIPSPAAFWEIRWPPQVYQTLINGLTPADGFSYVTGGHPNPADDLRPYNISSPENFQFIVQACTKSFWHLHDPTWSNMCSFMESSDSGQPYIIT